MGRRRHDTTVGPGAIIRTYAEADAVALAAQWLDTYGKNRRGANTKAFMWHVFSGSLFPSLSGAAALAEYEKQVAHECVVLSNARDAAFVTDQRPSDCSLFDYLVFPANLAWTMAFTHEDGWLGPYFARHPKYDSLNAANLARMRKEREAEVARTKGWA
jgi:hypothetical protein